MDLKTVLYGGMKAPEKEELIEHEIAVCDSLFRHSRTHQAQRYFQAMIDCLEDALDRCRREKDV